MVGSHAINDWSRNLVDRHLRNLEVRGGGDHLRRETLVSWMIVPASDPSGYRRLLPEPAHLLLRQSYVLQVVIAEMTHVYEHKVLHPKSKVGAWSGGPSMKGEPQRRFK